MAQREIKPMKPCFQANLPNFDLNAGVILKKRIDKSMQILLFLYLGYIALQAAIDDRRMAARAGAVLALVGVVNIPIIHYSVEWWSTLHQGPTVSKFDAPSIHISMLIPLLIMTFAFMTYFAAMLLVRMRCEILDQERNTSWVRELVSNTVKPQPKNL